MIRPATEADIPSLVEMGRAFFEESSWSALAAFDAASFERTLNLLIEGGSLLVAEYDGELAGMAAYAAVPLLANHSVRYAQEVFWYATQSGAGEALRAGIEDQARAQGAEFVVMSALIGKRDAAIARRLSSHGYIETERSLVKRL